MDPVPAPLHPPTVVAHGDAWASISALIERQVESGAAQVALAQGDTRVSYGELGRRSACLAGALRAHGVGRGDLVAVVLGRGIAFVETALALWKLGAAYLPLSPAHPDRWRADVMHRAAVSRSIGASGAHAVVGIPHLVLGRDTEGAAAVEPVELGPGELAYVICTSGSTGDPKLVMVEHRGIPHLAQAQRDQLGGLGPGSRVLQLFHPSFDAALFDIVSALAHGGRLELIDDHEIAGPALADVLVTRRITHAVLPAAVVRTLEPGRFHDLAVVLSIGDVCAPDTARRWRAHHRFLNGYGPTEATVCSTLHPVDVDIADGERVPIGRAIAGYHIVVVDDELRPVADGLAGEICIGGAGVARGYLGQPALTAERFVPDRFGPTPGGRLYRTGDVGRRLPGGAIEFLGRNDDQVKIRGVRIELGQIERELAASPGVRDAVVIVDAPDGHPEHNLIGYVVGVAGSSLSGIGLRDRLRGRLPGYLVPDAVVVVPEWPLTTSGKIDRGRLPRPTRPAGAAYVAPTTPDERALAQIAADLLGMERVSIHDNLFELGGHSLFASQLVARVRPRLHCQLELSTVFEATTVARIAAALAATSDAPSDDPGPRPARDGEPVVPSHGQQRVWLMHKLAPDAMAYHSQSVLRFAGELDLEALQASLTDLVRRHDVLRSRFPEVDGELRCELEPPWRVELPVCDLRDVDDARRSETMAEAVASAVRAFVQAPFDLARGRPARWLVVRVAEREHLLVHVEHHIVHDGWSFNVFLGDLIAGYVDYQRHGEVRRPALAVQYYDHARWHRRWCDGEAAAAQRRYWRAALDGAPTVLAFPRRGGAARAFQGRAPRLEIDAELAQRLEQLGQRAGCSLFTTLLAAFFVLLHRYTGAVDLLVGSALAARRWQATENLLGMFVNTVVLRGRLHGDPSFTDVLARVRTMLLDAHDHQDLPFELVLKQAVVDHVPGVNPLIQAMFSCHDTQPGPLDSVPWDVAAIEGLANGSAKFDLSVIAVPRYAADGHVAKFAGAVIHIPHSERSVRPSPPLRLQGITLAWEFNAALFDDWMIDGMLGAYLQLLRSVAAAPDAAISAIAVLDEAARHELLAAGRGPTGTPASGWLPDAVDRWARQTPDAPAVRSRGAIASYRELTRRSERLARRLRAAGIVRGAVVAVCLPAGIAGVVAQLGILRSGAGFLPLDPDHPSPWLASILGDSGARVVVTSAALAGRIPPSPGLQLLVLDDDRPAQAEDGGPALSGQPTDLAYVIYTSGSTGQPKGVQVEHGSVAARFARPGALDIGPGHAMLALASTAFDASIMEIWGPLLHGAAVHFPDAGWDVRALARCIADHGITHLFVTTPLFHEFVRDAPAAFDGMHQVLFGGDVVSPEACRRLRDRGVRQVSNVYGPTETTVIVTSQPLAAWRDGESASVPIGAALPNTHVVVLDDALQLVPPGAVGEICIGGPGVARGYLGAPELTARQFVADPFDPEPGARLYRTGDRGRWLPGGVLEFLGRRDTQLKVRGFRVDLEQVRAALLALPEVSSAVAVADRHGGDARILGYVVANPGTASSGTELRAALAHRVPRHLIPSVVTVLDRWPLTANGKLDRAGLPPPRDPASDPARGDAAASFAPPESSHEILLARIVAQLLGVERVGVHHNLFELGMDSLQAMRLVSSIATATQRELPLATLFAHPTVFELARALGAARAPAAPIRRLPR